jgi:hypothetical protein
VTCGKTPDVIDMIGILQNHSPQNVNQFKLGSSIVMVILLGLVFDHSIKPQSQSWTPVPICVPSLLANVPGRPPSAP